MEDREVIQQLGELSDMLDKESDDRDAGETMALLKRITEENRQMLLSLGQKPRAARGRAIIEMDKDQVVGGRKPRSTTVVENIQDEAVAFGGGRRRRGVNQSMAI